MRQLSEAELQLAMKIYREQGGIVGSHIGQWRDFRAGFTAALTHTQSTLSEIIAILESQHYENEAGALENNVEFMRLKEMVGITTQSTNNLNALDTDKVSSSHIEGSK